MLKSLSFFFLAIALIVVSKLIQVSFYDFLVPHHSRLEDTHESHDDHQEEAIDENSHEVHLEDPADYEWEEDEVADSVSAEEIQEVEQQEPSAEQEQPAVTSSENLTGEAYFSNLRNSYIIPKIANLPEGRSREDVVIRYYQHVKDEGKVFSLRDLGYYLHVKEAEDSKGYGSNSIFYGSQVDERDIQIVAFTLLQNGVPIKSIQPSAYNWKHHSIEIGADSLVSNQPVLSLEEVRNFSMN